MIKKVFNKKDSTAEKEATICLVKYESIDKSENIIISGHEFHFNNIVGKYKYWYCKYKRAQPRICKASCRQHINSNKKEVELIKSHSSNENINSCCPYISGITEISLIKAQLIQQTAENEVLQKVGKLLEENPTWDLLGLKANASKYKY